MFVDKLNIAVVIPCFKVEKHIANVVRHLPAYIKYIVLVDDCSPDGSLKVLYELQENDSRILIVEHELNRGVGGAMLSGFKKALDLNCDYVIKMDGDDQMDPEYIPDLLYPLAHEEYHFSKGNRFSNFESLPRMPLLRRIGNLGLSFMIKAASGYWSLFDPTNGYFCISRKVLERLKMQHLSESYFFESSLLIELFYTGAKICDVPIPARYGDEESNLSIVNTLTSFPPKLLKAFVRRVLLRYFIYEFSIYSIYLIFGLPLLSFGLIFGALKWIKYVSLNTPAPTGTVMIATLAIVLGFQLLLAVIHWDVTSENPFTASLKRKAIDSLN